MGKTRVPSDAGRNPSKSAAVDRAAEPPIQSGNAVLVDGSTIGIKSMHADDRDRLIAFFDSLSMESRRRRFFSALPRLEGPLLDRLLDIDQTATIALVAERDGEIVGVGRANRIPDLHNGAVAEVAFVVSDRLQGLGIGTLLLEGLASRARVVGIASFVAATQADNGSMLRVFRNAGYRAVIKRDPEDASLINISFPIEEDETSRTARRARERSAARASLRPLLRPKSIAVIGVSRNTPSTGRRVVQELIRKGFTGSVFPVNPNADAIEGLTSYASIASVTRSTGKPIDLAVIAVPAESALRVAQECADAGVRSLLVLSAGFAETGPEGRDRQGQLLEIVRGSGMRLIGPNCLGVITTDDLISMHAVFTDLAVGPGSIALMSQSGAVAIAIARLATQRGIGLSALVSVGNKADVSGNDLLEYWDQDDTTRVITLYLESFGNPRKFARLAREVSLHKPIVAIKAARSPEGSRAAASHTGALVAPDSTVDALFEQAGVLRVDEPGELLSVAHALEYLPLPKGRRVAVVGNAGGLAILTADALARQHLALAELLPDTVAQLQSIAPPNAALRNPVDLTANVPLEVLNEATLLVVGDAGVDAIVVVHVSVRDDDQRTVMAMLDQLVATSEKPIVSVFGTTPSSAPSSAPGSEPHTTDSGVHRVLWTTSPREAALVVERMVTRAEWLQSYEEVETPIETDALDRIRTIVATALRKSADDGWLSPTAAFEIMQLAGVHVAGPVHVSDADQAVAVASAVGYPVSIKAASPTMLHRSDLGAVRIGLLDDDDVMSAYQSMVRALGDEMRGAFVQPMAETGVEVIMGIKNDERFGSLVLIGAGGRNAEIWRDTSIHLAPLGRRAAIEMIHSLRSYPLLTGFRGASPSDQESLVDALLRLGQLAAEIPEIAEMDVNPIIVHPAGVTAVDVKIRLTPNRNPINDELRRIGA